MCVLSSGVDQSVQDLQSRLPRTMNWVERNDASRLRAALGPMTSQQASADGRATAAATPAAATVPAPSLDRPAGAKIRHCDTLRGVEPVTCADRHLIPWKGPPNRGHPPTQGTNAAVHRLIHGDPNATRGTADRPYMTFRLRWKTVINPSFGGKSAILTSLLNCDKAAETDVVERPAVNS